MCVVWRRFFRIVALFKYFGKEVICLLLYVTWLCIKILWWLCLHEGYMCRFLALSQKIGCMRYFCLRWRLWQSCFRSRSIWKSWCNDQRFVATYKAKFSTFHAQVLRVVWILQEACFELEVRFGKPGKTTLECGDLFFVEKWWVLHMLSQSWWRHKLSYLFFGDLVYGGDLGNRFQSS